MKVKFEDIGYNRFHDVNVYACICPDCGLHIFEFTDDDVSDERDSDDPEVMFKSSMVHHGYIGLGNFCERCGRRLDWGDYHQQHQKEHSEGESYSAAEYPAVEEIKSRYRQQKRDLLSDTE